MCTPRTGWGCPALGFLVALAAGYPPSGNAGRRLKRGGQAGGCELLGSGDASRRRAWPDMASLRLIFFLNGSLMNVFPGTGPTVEIPIAALREDPLL